MLIALSTSLYFLARPVAPAHADTTSTPTDITPIPTATCNPDGSSTVQVDLSAFVSAPAAGPVRVMLQMVPVGSTAFSPVTTGNVPTYVTMTTGGTNVVLNGETSASVPQVILIQAQGYAPETETIPACDPAQPAPNYLLPALASPPASFAATCVGTTPDTYNGTAAVTVTVTNPGSPTPAGYTPATYAAAYTAATGMAEIDYGVYLTDGSGNILAPTGVGMAQFDLAGDQPNGPATTDPANASSSFTIPSTGQTADEIWVVGTDGQASTALPLGQLPDCTPVPLTSAPVVVSSPTDSSTPTPTPSDTRSSASASSPADSSTAVTTTPATTADSPSDTPTDTPVQQETQAPVGPFVETSAAVPTASASPSPSPSLPLGSFEPLPTVGGDNSTTDTAGAATSADPTSSPTVVISGPAARISVHDTDVAGSASSIQPVQILRWHRDAALVVGFDALAICSLVGATVWSARRR